MPFKSKAQQRFLYAHPEKIGGKEKLKEWSNATDFSRLPEKSKKTHGGNTVISTTSMKGRALVEGRKSNLKHKIAFKNGREY